jgi:hypothetical protein
MTPAVMAPACQSRIDGRVGSRRHWRLTAPSLTAGRSSNVSSVTEVK